jgi:hypothetical protein
LKCDFSLDGGQDWHHIEQVFALDGIFETFSSVDFVPFAH